MRRRVFKNKRGYTLIELLVVMGIMAALSILSFSGYVIFKQQMYVKHIENQLQTDIRESFIRSIAVKDDGVSVSTDPCYKKVAKLRVIKIPLTNDFKGYQMVSYCEDSGTLLKKSSVTINPSDTVGYGAKVTSVSTGHATGTFLCLAYSSPYGEFGAKWFNGLPSVQPDNSGTNDECDTDIGNITNWPMKNDGSHPPPTSFLLSADTTITFSLSSNASVSQKIIIHPSGGADLQNL